MCGLAGIISPIPGFVQQHQLQQMSGCLQHRGPDKAAAWINANATVGFAHQRLSIIDLSETANQPLHYLHYTIIFNGEIYNFVELKQELLKAGYTFQTSSDTEVIVAAYDHWGTECLHQFDGMFAFVIYNHQSHNVFAARDRFGEKPFYYNVQYQQRGSFSRLLFASEMKSLWSCGLPKELNAMMMLNYITLGYVQNPLKKSQTFYSNVLSLPPGNFLLINVAEGKVTMRKWYSLKLSLPNHNITRQQAIDQFRYLFNQSINRRLRSDVSVGTSLSGGIDSSAVVAAIQQNNHGLTWSSHCFSAIFPGFSFDEGHYSSIVADNFRLKRFTTTPSAQHFCHKFTAFMHHQEEPVQSASVFTQYMVYELAKQQGITVLLDGQGADEILGGYKRYVHWYLQQLVRQRQLKKLLREKELLQQNDFVEQWSLKNYIAAFHPAKTAELLQQRAIKKQQQNQWLDKDFLVNNINVDSLQKPTISRLEDILYYNTFVHGLEELLRYADRNAMAHSREVRLPFLNHELVEFLFTLPSSFKMAEGYTKWILRKAVEPSLPPAITWRRGKIGYEPPQAEWMQHPDVKEMVMQSRQKLVNAGVLDAKVLGAPVSAKSAHDQDNYDWRYLCAAALT